MEVKRVGSEPSGKGPEDYFTGRVRVDRLFTAPEPARVAGASVTFEPSARTAWHTHPLGQTLIVTAGCRWVQREGRPVEAIPPGDLVWFAPNEKHWHGVTATTGMTHIAIQEGLNGKVVDWMERAQTSNTRLDQRPAKRRLNSRRPPDPRGEKRCRSANLEWRAGGLGHWARIHRA
jgi:quercetin dioxygenase-like cupin family protein